MLSHVNVSLDEISTTAFPSSRNRRVRQTQEHDVFHVSVDLIADVDWIRSLGVEQLILANTNLVTEGQIPNALYVVLDGVLEVRMPSHGPDAVVRLGAGELVGEVSFLDDKPATVNVRTCVNCRLLVLLRDDLNAKIATDPVFAARLYRSFARGLSRQMRAAQSAVKSAPAAAPVTLERPLAERCKAIAVALDGVKRALAEADRQAIRNDEQVPEDLFTKLREQFRAFCDLLNEEIGDSSTISPDLRRELGTRIQEEILPYMLLTKNGERWYSKPRGYAGDFMSIEWIYQDRAEGAGRLGPVIDRCFLDVPAAQAVRNRRGLLVEEIQKTMAETQEGPTRVLSMACGPAREIFDTFEKLADPRQLMATCLDVDMQALAHVADIRDKRKLKHNIRLENSNLVYLVRGQQKLDLPPLDLAYSIGLIDYFSDPFVVKLLDFVYEHLRPGGRVILGNFHPRNPSKALMDHVLDWKLIHRDEADMNRLFKASKFRSPCEEIRVESEGVNLFAIGRRPL